MINFSLPIGIFEIVIFLFAVVAFVLAVRFFMDSRKRLQQSFPGIVGHRKQLQFGFDHSGFLIPTAGSKRQEKVAEPTYRPAVTTSTDSTSQEIKELRKQLQQQQLDLTKALEKIAGVSQNTDVLQSKTTPVWEEQQKWESLRMQLAEKEAEIQRLKAQENYAQKLEEHYETLQAEFDNLKEQMQQMEKQTWQAAELTIQLDRAEQTQSRLETALHEKENKVHDLTLENRRLQSAFHELEDRISEASLQRQQLLKKIQLLEELNADMMQLAETNRKLKTEVARVAELESMLQLMTQERSWLRK